MALLKSKSKPASDLSDRALKQQISRATAAQEAMLRDRDKLIRGGTEAVKSRGAEVRELRIAAKEAGAELERRAEARDVEERMRRIGIRGTGSSAGRALKAVVQLGHSARASPRSALRS